MTLLTEAEFVSNLSYSPLQAPSIFLLYDTDCRCDGSDPERSVQNMYVEFRTTVIQHLDLIGSKV